MDNYLMRYKGKYRVMAEIDQSTNDFPRNERGVIDSEDLYIKCRYGNRVFHWGHNILEAYIPSKIRGNNVIEKIVNDHGNEIIFDIYRLDSEVGFKFKSKDIDTVIEYLHPLTAGASISPFSSRNLPKLSYTISPEDMGKYHDISDSVSKDDKLMLYRITQDFISKVLAKKPMYKGKNISAEMKREMLRGKEFIHKAGYWDEYLRYLSLGVGNVSK